MNEKFEILFKKTFAMQQEKWEKLFQILTDIDYEADIIEQRFQKVHNSIENIYNEALLEIETEKITIENNVSELLKKILSLRTQLKLSEPMPHEYRDIISTSSFIKAIPQLEAKIKQYEEQIKDRLTSIKQLLREEAHLCERLGKTPKNICLDPLPSENEMIDFQNYLDDLRQLIFEREEEFIQLKMDIINSLHCLDEQPTLELHRKVISEANAVFISNDDIQHLREWRESLQAKILENKSIITKLIENIKYFKTELRLAGEQIEDTSFTCEINDCSKKTIDKLNEEVRRLEIMRKANIKLFVEKLRLELLKWWDKCLYGLNQRKEFIPFKMDSYDDNLLLLHELELQKLKKHYEDNRKIYILLQKQNTLRKKLNYLMEKENCPNRYKNRGCELLKEEKERREVNQNLPKIEKRLLEEVKQYEQNTGMPFIIQDKTVENLISQDMQRCKGQNLKLSGSKKLRDKSNNIDPSSFKAPLKTNVGVKRNLMKSHFSFKF